MNKYLSMGFGVNSVAMYLLLQDQGINFEAIYSHHGADWPETLEYATMFIKKYPVKILIPQVSRPFKGDRKIWNKLINYCDDRKIIPFQYPRWCSVDWKKNPISKYAIKPCIMYIGYDTGEKKRAKIKKKGRIEYKWPLINAGMNREDCKKLIKSHGLQVPPKSGCFICPFQRKEQWLRLKKIHPHLFKIAKELEINSGRTFQKNKSLNEL